MSDQEMTRHDQVLLGLVFSLQAGAMQQLGKMQSPITGEMEKDLDQAKSTIDVLDMLKVKCRTDTPADILRIMDGAVMDLQLNYMDEVKKAKAAESEAAKPEAAKPEAEGDGEPEEAKDAEADG
ncbi:MAG: DUF1844 domain-containing protein [Gemmatimonadales bacterium]|nr:DUF1844 domain-containing protein [Gemmatimonadales bacterium]